MPFRKQIAEIQLRLIRATEEIERARAQIKSGAARTREAKAEIDKLLGTIARLKAEKSRLALHQRLADGKDE